MIQKKPFDEIIKSMNESLHKIEELKKENFDLDHILNGPELRKFSENQSIMQHSESSKKLIFTVKELAEMFHVTSRTIYNWIEQGLLNLIKVKSKTYFTSAHVDEFLKRNEVKSFKMRNS